MSLAPPASRRDIELGYLVGLGRAVGGAVVFSLPVLMTMEMWSLGAGMERERLAVLVALFVPLLIGLSRVIGFEETAGWDDAVRDGFAAFAVGFATSTRRPRRSNCGRRPTESRDEPRRRLPPIDRRAERRPPPWLKKHAHVIVTAASFRGVRG